MSDEVTIRDLIARIDAAWRAKQFVGLSECFHEDAAIIGPGHVEYARGRAKCAESYVEFASNADVLAYEESSHALRVWANTAVYTFSWQMTYRRGGGPKRESGTDELVFGLGPEGWQLVLRHIEFAPKSE